MAKYLTLLMCIFLIGNNIYADNTPMWAQFIPGFARQYIPGLSNSSAQQGVVTYGPSKYEEVTLPLLDAFGPVSLVKVKVEGKTITQGPLDVKESELNALEVNGPVFLHGTIVKGHATINGPLFADTKSEMQDISISTNELTLKNSTANNIVVRKSDSYHHKRQTIYLEGTAHIKGDITFEQKGGEVIIRDSAKIDGQVIGGEILKGQTGGRMDTPHSMPRENMSYGVSSYHNQVLPDLTTFGSADLLNVKVQGNTTVHGSLEAKHSEFRDIEASGSITLSNSTVSGHTIVNGGLNVENNSTLHNISIASDQMTLKDSTANNILVRSDHSDKDERQVVYLEGNSHIKGNIKFEQPGGQVIIRDSAKIDGKVIRGEVLRSESTQAG